MNGIKVQTPLGFKRVRKKEKVFPSTQNSGNTISSTLSLLSILTWLSQPSTPMSGFPVYPPLIHVDSPLLCPNPLCNIKAPHDYVDLLPVPSIPIGILQLEIVCFTHPNPFPAVNCWKLVSPIAFDPKDERMSCGFIYQEGLVRWCWRRQLLRRRVG